MSVTDEDAAGRPVCLIATLGTEAQVVTLALQALQRAGEPVEQVIVIRTAAREPRLEEAARRLAEAFERDERLAEWGGRFEYAMISGAGGPVRDLLAEDDFAAGLRAVYEIVRDVKQAGHRVHLNLSGGRKLIALCGMVAAQLLFDAGDRLWYVWSAPELVASRELFAAAPDQARLVPVPLLRWSPAPPILTGLALAENPIDAITWQHERLAQAKLRFLRHDLTPAERAAVELAVQTGATDADLAAMLHKSPRTVSHQLATVYEKLRVFLGVREDVAVGRHTLMAEFGEVVGETSGPRRREGDEGREARRSRSQGAERG